MTRIVIFSDTHGSINPCLDIIDNLSPDMIIHCGDITRDCNDLASVYPDIPFYAVAGNNDYSSLPTQRIIEVDSFRLFVTHGHMYGVKGSYERIAQYAKEQGADVCIFGHTHLSIDEQINGVHLLNPGSLTRPYGTPPSYAVIEIEDNRLRSSIIFVKNSFIWNL